MRVLTAIGDVGVGDEDARANEHKDDEDITPLGFDFLVPPFSDKKIQCRG